MGERCQDECTLADYAICEPWIAQVHIPAVIRVLNYCFLSAVQSAVQMGTFVGNSSADIFCRPNTMFTDYLQLQVTGFVVNPEQPGKHFVEGVLVPCS